MNYILSKSSSAIFRLLLRCKPAPVRLLLCCKPGPVRLQPQPPLQTATRHYRTYRRRLRAVSHSAKTSSRGLFGQWPTVQRLLAQTSLAEYSYYISPRHSELIHFARGRLGRAPWPWYHDWRKVAARVLLPGAAAIAAYYHNLETVPYTNRTHLVVLPPRLDRRLGELMFDDIKEEHAAKILPSDHRDSVRVRKITSDILRAAERTLAPVKRGGGLLDDRWMAKSYGSQQAKAMTRHLDGLDWEVIVVEDKQVNAMCVPGKIVVYTGLLDYFKTDAEIASVLGHEVGHIIARHTAEAVSKKLCSFVLRLVIWQFFASPGLVKSISTLLFKLPFSRGMEIEADRIGMLLLAAAGFDPHIAVEVEEKLGKITGDSGLQNYLSTHPSSKKRVQFLLQDKVLREAMELYRENGPDKEAERFGISDPFDTNTRLIV